MTLGVMEGVAEASRVSGCPVVGGDVSAGGVLIGGGDRAWARSTGARPVLRSGAAAGDVILVTGPCGGSAAGLRVLRVGRRTAPRAGARSEDGCWRRPTGGRWPAWPKGRRPAGPGRHAMIDVSDGLALDLHRLADASGVGFALDAVPVAEGATLEEALGAGRTTSWWWSSVPTGSTRLRAIAAPRPGLRAAAADRRGDGADPARPDASGAEELARLGWQHRLG